MSSDRAEPLVEPIRWDGSPLELFRRIARGRHPFLLLSGGPPENGGRWAIMGSDPFRVWSLGSEDSAPDPFEAVARLADRYPTQPCPPLPFVGGLVGYLGYECLRFVESVPVRAPGPGDPPDAWFAAYGSGVLLDVRDGSGWIVATGWPEEDVARRRDRARQDCDRLHERLQESLPPRPSAPASGAGPLRSSLSPAEYRRSVQEVLGLIRDGDLYQANLTQRFELPLTVEDPVGLFERLHEASAAPHAAFLDLGGWQLLSTSPERFVSLEGRRAESRPIKGTAPRGRDSGEDQLLRRRLLESPKDRAENLMIVDLVRNDLNRVCEPGTVTVDTLAGAETYATLHHLVSTVSGRLAAEHGRADLLRALFPPGSMTGAPKVRAMEVLQRLEPMRRGPYAGGLGYLSFAGGLDLSVVIRTLLTGPHGARFHVGGGVVADSDPEAEYEESLLKARALRQVLGA